jgi:hypothetical protein
VLCYDESEKFGSECGAEPKMGEGGAFNRNLILSLYLLECHDVFMVGGGARARVWRPILAADESGPLLAAASLIITLEKCMDQTGMTLGSAFACC